MIAICLQTTHSQFIRACVFYIFERSSELGSLYLYLCVPVLHDLLFCSAWFSGQGKLRLLI